MIDFFRTDDIIYARYDSDTQDLQLTLLDGVDYNYENVSNKLWCTFKNSDHKESYFYRFIKRLGKDTKDKHLSFVDVKLNIERQNLKNEKSEKQSGNNSNS